MTDIIMNVGKHEFGEASKEIFRTEQILFLDLAHVSFLPLMMFRRRIGETLDTYNVFKKHGS